jgi:hypothetical protein
MRGDDVVPIAVETIEGEVERLELVFRDLDARRVRARVQLGLDCEPRSRGRVGDQADDDIVGEQMRVDDARGGRMLGRQYICPTRERLDDFLTDTRSRQRPGKLIECVLQCTEITSRSAKHDYYNLGAHGTVRLREGRPTERDHQGKGRNPPRTESAADRPAPVRRNAV